MQILCLDQLVVILFFDRSVVTSWFIFRGDGCGAPDSLRGMINCSLALFLVGIASNNIYQPKGLKQTPCRFQIPNCLVTWLNMSCCGVISLADFLPGWHDVIHVLEVPRAPDMVWCGVRGTLKKSPISEESPLLCSPVVCRRVRMSKAISVAYGLLFSAST